MGARCAGETQTSAPRSGDFAYISSGTLHSCALHDDGRPYCWGYVGGVIEIPFPPEERFVFIDSGTYHVCALRSDGSPVCWGGNGNGQASPPNGEQFITVSGGDWHTRGLRSDGTPVCWGHEQKPPRGELFASISSGAQHTCALRADRSAVCWGGDNTWGQTSAPEDEQFVTISSGYEHTCALRDDGSVFCWGRIDPPPPNLAVAPSSGVVSIPTPTPTPAPTSVAPRGHCSAYDPTIDWLEAPYVGYSICYTEEYASDVAFVKRWIDHARTELFEKYKVDQLRNGQTKLDLSIMLLPEPNDDAGVGLTRFRCCHNASGELSDTGSIANIPYLTPSHPDWSAYQTLGKLGLPHDDAHAKNLVHEFTHAVQHSIWGFWTDVPEWVREGLAEYEGLFNATEHNRTVGLSYLIRYVHDRIPDRIFLATSVGSDAQSITTSDVYFGGNLIMKYLADKFGEDIHLRLVDHTYPTFNEAMDAEYKAADTTAAEVFKDLQAWITQHYQGP